MLTWEIYYDKIENQIIKDIKKDVETKVSFNLDDIELVIRDENGAVRQRMTLDYLLCELMIKRYNYSPVEGFTYSIINHKPNG